MVRVWHGITKARSPNAVVFGLVIVLLCLGNLFSLLSLLIHVDDSGPGNPDVVRTRNALLETRTAVLDHRAKFGSLASSNGVPLHFQAAYEPYDRILLAEGFLDKPFKSKLGTHAMIRLSKTSRQPTAPEGTAYGYERIGHESNEPASSEVLLVEAVLSHVKEEQAAELNSHFDGPQLGTTAGQDDDRGSVIYRYTGQSIVEVRIYISHQ